MKKTVLILLIQESSPRTVFMGLKKFGFGAGKYCAYGGKLEPGETEKEAALRELKEESGIIIDDSQLHDAGFLTFCFPAKPEWNLTTQVFSVHEWDGIPKESDEICPANFPISEIPYSKMWPDSILWLPLVLEGKQVIAKFIYDSNNENLTGHEVRITEQPSYNG